MTMTDNNEFQWHYSVYGQVLSSNQPIPALIPAVTAETADTRVSIRFDDTSVPDTLTHAQQKIYTSPGLAGNDVPFFQVWRTTDLQSHLVIRYTQGDGLAQFLLRRDGSAVTITWDKVIPFDDILTYLLGPVLGCMLRLGGHICLHAGVVSVDNKAIAIIGSKRSGKSTTTAALALFQKLPVLSDDIAVIAKVKSQYLVYPGYPCLRLWPATVNSLSGMHSEHLPRILSFSEKRYLSLAMGEENTGWHFQPKPLPLAGVYALHTAVRQTRNISFDTVTGGEALYLLATHVYPEYTLLASMRKEDFEFLGHLIHHIPVQRLTRPDNLSLLSSVSRALVDNARTL